MTETVTIEGQGITIDLLLWRRFGVVGQTLVPATLALNPGLAALGPVLPAGRRVVLPSAPAERSLATPVDLFG